VRQVVICIGDTGIEFMPKRARRWANGWFGQHDISGRFHGRCRHTCDAGPPPGRVVLLSPAAPSYGQYRDYIERGRALPPRRGWAALRADRSHTGENGCHPLPMEQERFRLRTRTVNQADANSPANGVKPGAEASS
jgi:hypothetical protein